MAAPIPTARGTPAGIMLEDGYQTLVTIGSLPTVSFWEKTVKPPGVDGGDPIDTTTMHNADWRTRVPRQLMTLTDCSGKAAYDPAVHDQLLDFVNVNTTITVRFSDNSTLAFYGFLRLLEFDELVEGTHPELSYTITPTNYDPADGTEAAPVLEVFEPEPFDVTYDVPGSYEIDLTGYPEVGYELCGGGAGGCGRTTGESATGGAGGGGGGYAAGVLPGAMWASGGIMDVIVGAGGAGGFLANGTIGGGSTLQSRETPTTRGVDCFPGQPPTSGCTLGGGGGVAEGFGGHVPTTTVNGQNGFDPAGTTGGDGGDSGTGAAGGAGAAQTLTGGDGTVPGAGGGGGGAGDGLAAASIGGNGARGFVRLFYPPA